MYALIQFKGFKKKKIFLHITKFGLYNELYRNYLVLNFLEALPL